MTKPKTKPTAPPAIVSRETIVAEPAIDILITTNGHPALGEWLQKGGAILIPGERFVYRAKIDGAEWAAFRKTDLAQNVLLVDLQ